MYFMIGIWNTLLRMITYNYYATNSCIHTGKSTVQFYKRRQIHWYSVGIEFDALSGYRLSWDASFCSFVAWSNYWSLPANTRWSFPSHFLPSNLQERRSFPFVITQNTFCYCSGSLSLVCLRGDLSVIPEQFMWDLWWSKGQRGVYLLV